MCSYQHWQCRACCWVLKPQPPWLLPTPPSPVLSDAPGTSGSGRTAGWMRHSDRPGGLKERRDPHSVHVESWERVERKILKKKVKRKSIQIVKQMRKTFASTKVSRLLRENLQQRLELKPSATLKTSCWLWHGASWPHVTSDMTRHRCKGLRLQAKWST